MIEKPIVIASYQDFLDRAEHNPGHKSLFSQLLPEYEKFRDAPINPLERRIFKHSDFMTMDAPSMLSRSAGIWQQRNVAFGRDIFIIGFGLGSFKLLTESVGPDVRVLHVQEEDPKKFTNVMAWSEKSNPLFQHEMRRMLARLSEAGLMVETYTKAPIFIAEHVLEGHFETDLKLKITSKVEEVKPEMIDIDIRHLKLLLHVYTGMMTLASILLIHELAVHICTHCYFEEFKSVL